MFKKIVKTASVLGAAYLAYKIVETGMENHIKVRELSYEELIEMMLAKKIKIVCDYPDAVAHFVSSDKKTALRAHVENDKVSLIEVFDINQSTDQLEVIYIGGKFNKNTDAYLAFKRLLGSAGVNERDFINLVTALFKYPHLEEISI